MAEAIGQGRPGEIGVSSFNEDGSVKKEAELPAAPDRNTAAAAMAALPPGMVQRAVDTLTPVAEAPAAMPPPPPVTFKHSAQVDQIFAALAAAQGELQNPIKTKTATIKSDRGSYTYHYCDIADVLTSTRGPFSKNGIGVAQFPTVEEKVIKMGNQDRVFAKVTIETYLTHKSGQWMACSLWAMAEGAGPQALGSVSTYLRRYGLQLIAGIAADDDEDGNEGQGDQPGGAGGNAQVSGGNAPAGPQRTAAVNDQPWTMTTTVRNYEERDAGGGRIKYLIELDKGGWVSTMKKALGQKIGREAGTGLSVTVQLKRFRNEIDLLSGDVVQPGAPD